MTIGGIPPNFHKPWFINPYIYYVYFMYIMYIYIFMYIFMCILCISLVSYSYNLPSNMYI
jgi:hypothetical protein